MNTRYHFTNMWNQWIKKKQGHNTGFTLFEILIAIFILGIVISTIYGAYSGTFSIVDTVTQEAEIYAMARIATERIVEDLEALYLPIDIPSDDSPNPYGLITKTGMGDAGFGGLIFTSTAHISFTGQAPDGMIARIAYFLRKEDDSEVFALYRMDKLSPGGGLEDEMSSGEILCEDLKGVEFVYYDAKGDPHEAWDSGSDEWGNRVPAMVTVKLLFANPYNPDSPYLFSTGVAIPAGLRGQG